MGFEGASGIGPGLLGGCATWFTGGYKFTGTGQIG